MKNPPITLLGQNACFCRRTDDLPRAVMGEFVSKGNFYRQVWNHILISLMDSQHGDASGCMVGRKWCAAKHAPRRRVVQISSRTVLLQSAKKRSGQGGAR